ncbi:MAG: pyruvate ferredoxin oxidoreductase [Clostridiales Family XIII bacterium]|jgi:pyruvate ferredoxin oxidoreductase alpha subunit|nr:pyruvate ferredoxin oxidoreductase [Clostridiales Family XIII bacterium]
MSDYKYPKIDKKSKAPAFRERMSGNEAVSYAIRQIDPDVIAAFPITPSTEIPQYISKYKADGKISTEFVTVESEHSAMSACIGASASGVRAMTATSSAGMALMYELLYVAASDRLPVVMAAVNRALTGPININADHSDSMGARDSGWIQIYSENAQEAYDNMLMAHRIGEHPDVKLPVMICQDGFITSHAIENILLESDEFAKEFVGEYTPEKFLLNTKESLGVGPYGISPYYMEAKRGQEQAMENAREVIAQISKLYSDATGRLYDFFEAYRMDDAEYAILIMGSASGTAKDAVDNLRAEGKKVGLIKLRVFRPFPFDKIAQALSKVKGLAIMDRSEGFSASGGPLGAEVRSALYGRVDGIKTINYIYGLGGRDMRVRDFEDIYAEIMAIKADEIPELYKYYGVRER